MSPSSFITVCVLLGGLWRLGVLWRFLQTRFAFTLKRNASIEYLGKIQDGSRQDFLCAVFFFHSCIKKKKTVGNAKRTLKMSDLTQIRLQPQHQNVLLLINSRVILHFFPSMKYFQCEQFATPFKPTNVMLSYFERVLGKPLLLLLHLHIAATKMSHRNLFLNNSASTHSHVEFST